jgi:hypothetical protein
MDKPGRKSVYSNPMFESWDSYATAGLQSSLEAVAGALRDQGLPEDEIDEKLSQILRDSILEAISVTSPSIVKSLQTDAPRMLAEHRRLREGFENRLKWVWGEALDLLYEVMVSCAELGEAYGLAYREDAANDNDYRFDALVRLHARACLIASEIHALLRSGHGWGAQARWRTLHEISVVAAILGDNDQELSRRYLIHCNVEECRDIELDLKHGRTSLDESEAKDELDEIARIRAEAKAEFGPLFKKAWGWSASLFDKGEPNFERLEELAELSHLRPHYRLSSHLTHAGSTGVSMILQDFGDGHIFMTGSSNAGLSEPGQCCAISIVQIMHTLVTYGRPEGPNPLLLAAVQSIQSMQDQAMKSLVAAEDNVEALTKSRRAAAASGRVALSLWYFRILIRRNCWQFMEFWRIQYSRLRRLVKRDNSEKSDANKK